MLGPFIIGLTGLTLSKEDIARIQNPAVGGLILFTRNFESKAQLIDLVESIRSNGGLSKPVFVDHEGGRVQRFRNGFTAIPSMRQIGQRAETDFDDAVLLAREAGFVMAAELRACGIDMSFAPVLDLDWGNSEIIGDRSFGKDARMVSRLSSALMNGMALAGMQACGKHFPGHGWVSLDSHLALPHDNRSLNEILKVDALPYQLNSTLNMASIMPAHVVYSEVDPMPACFSSFWIQEVLRVKFSFDGAVISDDLDMVGAHGVGDIRARASAALQAGCDAVLACNNFDDIDTLVNKPVPEVHENREVRSRRLSRLLSGQSMNWDDLRQSYVYQAAIDRISNA
ncbi:beta-N-acetylhexosaminidase [Limnobacter sp. MED105]|uniref:beta-N-acetylhexosaminidase n=1 Tax=unclassified Limnobacter TaxID=2630203 RepID=UPI000156CF7A|nr:beta-N-acetylhexosaminidase [Limnobacter sp. MED105]EDM84042.1 beta-hexosaminidase [Limnobacter sp. MED105]